MLKSDDHISRLRSQLEQYALERKLDIPDPLAMHTDKDHESTGGKARSSPPRAHPAVANNEQSLADNLRRGLPLRRRADATRVRASCAGGA